jgi:hypothetical protein
MTGRHEMLVEQNADVPMRDNAILMGLALPKGSRLTRATGGDWPASGRRLVHSRRPDRSSARIFCRHEHASHRRAVPILPFSAMLPMRWTIAPSSARPDPIDATSFNSRPPRLPLPEDPFC